MTSPLPNEILARILQKTGDVHLLLELGVLNLTDSCECLNLVANCTHDEIVKLYLANHRETAEIIILHHLDHVYGNSEALVQPESVLYRNGTAGVGRSLLDTAIKYGTDTELLLRMLDDGGSVGYRPLVVAAEEGRFDTLRALFHNDWYGNCYLTSSVIYAVIRRDDVIMAEWMFTDEVARAKLFGFGLPDFCGWLQLAAEHDAVNIFIYLHENHSKACAWDIVNHVISEKATKIMKWMIEGGCKAIRLSAIGFAAGDPKEASNPLPHSSYHPDEPEMELDSSQWRPINLDAVNYLKKHITTLQQNQKSFMCGSRFYVPHYDYYTYGVLDDQY